MSTRIARFALVGLALCAGPAAAWSQAGKDTTRPATKTTAPPATKTTNPPATKTPVTQPKTTTAPAVTQPKTTTAPAVTQPKTTTAPAATQTKTTSPATNQTKSATAPVTQQPKTATPGKTATPPATQQPKTTSPATQQPAAKTAPAPQNKTAGATPPQQNKTAGATPPQQNKTAGATPPQNKTVTAPPQNKTAAAPPQQNKTAPPATKTVPGAGAAAAPQTPARDTVIPTVMMREVFDYNRNGRPDPFISLLTTTDLRPTLSDLKLLMTVVDEPGRSVALVQDAYDTKKPQKTLRVGQKLGRMRVSSIRSDAVVFTIEEFGMNRRDSLLLRDSTKARGR